MPLTGIDMMTNLVKLMRVDRKTFAHIRFKFELSLLAKLVCPLESSQKWHLQKSASDYGVKIELRPVLAQFKANLSFPTPGMLLSGSKYLKKV